MAAPLRAADINGVFSNPTSTFSFVSNNFEGSLKKTQSSGIAKTELFTNRDIDLCNNLPSFYYRWLLHTSRSIDPFDPSGLHGSRAGRRPGGSATSALQRCHVPMPSSLNTPLSSTYHRKPYSKGTLAAYLLVYITFRSILTIAHRLLVRC